MKILYLSHQFLPDYSAGTEILTYNTAKEILRRGHKAGVFTGYPVKGRVTPLKSFDWYEYDGISVDRFYHSNTSSILPENPMEAEYNNLFFADYFRKRLQQISPDIVHFYHLQRLSASAIDVCVELGIPTVFTATDFWPVCPANQLLLPDNSLCPGPDESMVNCLKHLVEISQGQNIRRVFKLLPDRMLALFIGFAAKMNSLNLPYISLVKGLAERPAFMRTRMKRLNMVLVATQFMGEVLNRFGVDSKKIRHLPFAIDRNLIPQVSAKGENEKLRIGFIGTLSPHKGAHLLLEAVRLLSVKLQLEVKIYGSLKQFPEYALILKSMAGGDRRVKFCGTFSNSRIGDILYGLDVLIVPSLWYENAPLVILSAQAAGVPVVAADLGGMSELIEEGKNGLLFEKGDAKGLSDIIRMLCADRLMIRHLSNLSNHSVKPKSMLSYVDELEEIYDDILKLSCKNA